MLIVSNNLIGAEGDKVLSESLKLNRSLRVVDIGSNKMIDAEGIKFLSEYLKINPPLNVLEA